jgi:hypothetical protein
VNCDAEVSMGDPTASEGRIREAYARTMRDAGSEHPSEEIWVRLAAGDLSPADRTVAFDHITRCARCADTYRALSALRHEAAAIDQEVALPVERRPLSARVPRGWMLAAAAAAVLAVALPLLLRDGLPPGGDRSAAADTIAGLTAERQASGDVVFRWQIHPGADRYRVIVRSEEGVPVWRSEPTGAGETSAASGTLRTGTWFWEVEGLEGEEVTVRSTLERLVL